MQKWLLIGIVFLLLVVVTFQKRVRTFLAPESPYFELSQLDLNGSNPGMGDGFDEKSLGIVPLFVHEGRLLCGTGNALNGAQIWALDDPAGPWVKVASGGLSGNPGNFAVISKITFNGHFYLSVWSKDWDGRQGAETWGLLFRIEVDPISGQLLPERVDPPEGFGGTCVMGHAQYNDYLYVGITGQDQAAGTGAKMYRIQDGHDGAPINPLDWEKVDTPFEANFNNTDVSALAVFEGKLYAGLENWEQGCEVWEYDPLRPEAEKWQLVSAPGFGKTVLPDLNKNCFWLVAYQGNQPAPRLYAQTWNDAGSEFRRYEGGGGWTLIKKYKGNGGGIKLRNGKLLTATNKNERFYFDGSNFQAVYTNGPNNLGDVADYQGELYASTMDFYNFLTTAICLLLPASDLCPPSGQIWRGQETTKVVPIGCDPGS